MECWFFCVGTGIRGESLIQECSDISLDDVEREFVVLKVFG